MTTPDPKDGPTQAQLEAALYAIRPSSLSAADMKAALIAAAEAGRYPTGLDAISAFEKAQAQRFQEKEDEAKRINEAAGRQERALTAAEVGEPCGCGYDNPDDVCMVHEPIIKGHVAATIERCAQVVDKWMDGTDLDALAAAIRAMKDQL